jgi:hypothetical protein
LVSCQYRHYGSLLSSRTSFHSYSTFLIKNFRLFLKKNLKNVLQSSLRPQERKGQRSHSLRAGGQSSWQPLSIFKIHKYSLFHLSHRSFGFIMIKMAPPHLMLEILECKSMIIQIKNVI